MRGITNAQGITGPHLNGILERLSLLENNPPVGSVTTFAGFDWVVVHWDTALKRMYLMLKGIYTKTAWADSGNGHVSYENSNVKAELLNFENLLEYRLSPAYENNEALIKIGAYAFIPTMEELQSFSFFQRTTTALNRVLYSGHAIATEEERTVGWWLSSCKFSYTTDSGTDYWGHDFIDAYGALTSQLFSDIYDGSGYSYGVRPFIRMKMR